MPPQASFAPNAQTAQFTITAIPVATLTTAQITVGPAQPVPGVATLTVEPPPSLAAQSFRRRTMSPFLPEAHCSNSQSGLDAAAADAHH